MSDNLPQTRQAAAIEGRSARNRVTGKLKTAIDLMVWQGLRHTEAAAKAGLAAVSIRAALRKPHVLQYLRAENAALRASVQSRDLHRLDDIADNSKNDMARVTAIKTIERIADLAEQESGRPGAASPGVVIQIINAPEQKIISRPETIIEQAPFPPLPRPSSAFSDT